MPTLKLNPDPKNDIVMDKSSAAWLMVCRRNSEKNRACAMPKPYFDVLKAWGYVSGTFAAARISPDGLARMIAEEQAAARETKTQEPKTH